MEAEKQPLDFISFDRENHPPGSHLKKNKINYGIILNNLPIPISFWEAENSDFRLIYLNKTGMKKLQPVLRLGILLSKALPEVYWALASKISVPGYSARFIGRNLLVYHQHFEDLFSEQIPELKKGNFKEEAFHTIIEPSPVSCIITDIDGNIEYVNRKFTEVTGYSADEVIGKNPRLLKSDEKSSEEYKLLWDTILSGNDWKGEFINKRKNGEVYYEFAVISPIKNESGAITNFIAFKEDITKLKEAENELRKTEKFAALGKMAAYVSHEIKTPLTSIKLNVDMLEQDDSIPSDARRSLSIIQKEVKRLNNLLKNVLQFSNYKHLYFSRINLSKKIESIHEFIKPLLEEHGITLHNNTLGSYVYGDPQQLRSLFIHLLENSIESINNKGEINIYSEVHEKECHVYIKDTGCGINNIKDIFEPFYSTKSTGTGLGLPIAKNIVERHNGVLRLVSSKPGETIFEIVLPTRGEIGKASNH
ncbi:MAG TPA: PAS domain S-box protein [Ignavibacteriaceae bacterium]|nr:PAS domain S-box protein [Ignavibacteriaceae bacterium]